MIIIKNPNTPEHRAVKPSNWKKQVSVLKQGCALPANGMVERKVMPGMRLVTKASGTFSLYQKAACSVIYSLLTKVALLMGF